MAMYRGYELTEDEIIFVNNAKKGETRLINGQLWIGRGPTHKHGCVECPFKASPSKLTVCGCISCVNSAIPTEEIFDNL